MDYSGYQWGWVPRVGALGGLGLVALSPLAPGYPFGMARGARGLVAGPVGCSSALGM